MKRMAWIGAAVLACASSGPGARAETNAPAADAPAEVRALMASGQRSLMQEDWEDAAVRYQKILELDPKNDEARFGLGTAYGQLGRYKEALELLEGLLAANSQSAALKNNIAWIYAKAKDPAFQNPEKAVKLARDAVLMTPADCNMWNTLAEAYYALKNYPKALRSARHAFRLSQLSGAPDEKSFRDLLERCQEAADSDGGEP